MRHLLNPLDFTVEEIDELLAVAHDIEQKPFQVCPCLRWQKIGDLFL